MYVSADGQSFTEVAAGTWAGDARLKTATFTPVDARYVRLEGHRALGGSYLSAAEVSSADVGRGSPRLAAKCRSGWLVCGR
ncbi:discoidin domain-containing protein [Nonomuraea sp. NBC_00507]|uniref:discoidin domain-containing protein n=1 Tax=Nonomuraea sp. NBC_00507 TaxID=2976002 RepID=UPI003FA53BED